MPVKSSAIKRHGIDIFEGGVFASTNVGADMQHYSDLLGISAQKIESLMAIADISDVPKLAAALNGAFQNARWISSDLEQYVRPVFTAEGINVTPIPFNKLATAILALTKALNNYPTQFAAGNITLAAIKKQIKAGVAPIISTLKELSEDYDMYAGMVSSVIDKSQANTGDLKQLLTWVLSSYEQLGEFMAGEFANRKWRVNPKNIGPINNIIYGLNKRIEPYADSSNPKYINSPAIVSAIEGYNIACNRLRNSDPKKYWTTLDPVAIAMERLKDVL